MMRTLSPRVVSGRAHGGHTKDHHATLHRRAREFQAGARRIIVAYLEDNGKNWKKTVQTGIICQRCNLQLAPGVLDYRRIRNSSALLKRRALSRRRELIGLHGSATNALDWLFLEKARESGSCGQVESRLRRTDIVQ